MKDSATTEVGRISEPEAERLFERLLKIAVVEELGRKLDEATSRRGGNPVHLAAAEWAAAQAKP